MPKPKPKQNTPPEYPIFLQHARAVYEEGGGRRLREALARKAEVSESLTRLSAKRQKRFKEKKKPAGVA